MVLVVGATSIRRSCPQEVGSSGGGGDGDDEGALLG